jgi:hypothetical protein
MLHRPTHRDVPEWIDWYKNDAIKFMNMGMAFTMDRLRNLAPALVTVVEGHLEELQQQPVVEPELIEELCEAAPRLENLMVEQRNWCKRYLLCAEKIFKAVMF